MKFRNWFSLRCYEVQACLRTQAEPKHKDWITLIIPTKPFSYHIRSNYDLSCEPCAIFWILIALNLSNSLAKRVDLDPDHSLEVNLKIALSNSCISIILKILSLAPLINVLFIIHSPRPCPVTNTPSGEEFFYALLYQIQDWICIVDFYEHDPSGLGVSLRSIP